MTSTIRPSGFVSSSFKESQEVYARTQGPKAVKFEVSPGIIMPLDIAVKIINNQMYDPQIRKLYDVKDEIDLKRYNTGGSWKKGFFSGW